METGQIKYDATLASIHLLASVDTGYNCRENMQIYYCESLNTFRRYTMVKKSSVFHEPTISVSICREIAPAIKEKCTQFFTKVCTLIS